MASARDASKRGDLALSAFQSLVDEVQTNLGDQPVTRDMRRVLLEGAIVGFRQLAEEAPDCAADLGILMAHLRLAILYRQVGQTDKSRQEHETTIRIAAVLTARGIVEAMDDAAMSEQESASSTLRWTGSTRRRPIFAGAWSWPRIPPGEPPMNSPCSKPAWAWRVARPGEARGRSRPRI